MKKKLYLLLAISTPMAGSITPPGNPGRFKYSRYTIKNKNIIPYFNMYSTTKLTLFTINLPRNHYLDKYIYLIYLIYLLYITYHHFFYYTVNFSLQINVYFLIC